MPPLKDPGFGALPEHSGDARLSRRGCQITNANVSIVTTLFEYKISPNFLFFSSSISALKSSAALNHKIFKSEAFRLSLRTAKMRFWTTLTAPFHFHHSHSHKRSHHTRMSSKSSELSETAKGKQPENVEETKTVHFKKGGRAKGRKLTRKHDRSSGERLRKSTDE
jgi:hypothetical protein